MDSVGRVAVEGRLFWMECGGLVEKGGGGGVQSSGSRFTVSSLPFPTSSKVLSPFLFAKLEYHPFARSGSSLQYRSALAKGKVVSVRVR